MTMCAARPAMSARRCASRSARAGARAARRSTNWTGAWSIRVRRQDNVLTQWQYSKPEPVIIYNGTVTSDPTNTLYYVDNTAGAG